MMGTVRRYLQFVARHPVAYPVVAIVAAAVSVALYPGDPWTWIIAALAAAWLATAATRARRTRG